MGWLKSRRLGRGLLHLEVALTYAFLYLPILVLVIYGFSASRFAIDWGGFSLTWYQKLLRNRSVQVAIFNSLLVALVSSVLATFFGSLLAFAFERAKLRWRRTLQGLALLPLLIPEIVMAIGLLVFFMKLVVPGFQLLGLQLPSFASVTFGHMLFSTSYVVVVVRGRLKLLDRSIEEAAANLGANRWQVFRHVTLPLVMPALVSGGFLAFTLSLDDFYVSYFATVGGSGFQTMPLYLYALQAKAGITPEINSLASLMLMASLLLAAFGLAFHKRQL